MTSLLFPPFHQFLDGNGDPLSGGTATFYETGTSTKLDTFSDKDLTTANPNPITLDTLGMPQSAGGAYVPVFGKAQDYKVVLESADSSIIITHDPVQGSPVASNTPIIATGDSNSRTLARRFADRKIASKADLSALDVSSMPQNEVVRVLGRSSVGDGYAGEFRWDNSDLSSNVTNDTQGGVYVPPDSDTSGASGAWVRTGIDDHWHSVAWFGVTGDGTTDDYTAFQAAIDYVESVFGALWVPAGYSCVVETQLVIDTDGFRLSGANRNSSSIRSRTADQQVLKVDGATAVLIENLLIYNNEFTTDSNAYVVWLENCVQTKIDNCWLQGGYYPLLISGNNCTDSIISRCLITKAYGQANAEVQRASSGLNGAHRFESVLFNQDYPVQVPTSSDWNGAWAASTSVTVGEIRTIDSGAFYIQCQTAGTTGSSEPAAANYDVIIPDGTAEWLLLGSQAQRGLRLNTGSVLCTVYDCDATGALSSGYEVANTLSGDAPWGHELIACESSGAYDQGVNFAAGAEHSVEGGYFQSTAGPATTFGIRLAADEACRVHGANIFNYDTGVDISAPRCSVRGSTITGCGNGVNIAGSVSWTRVCENHLGGTTKRGNNTNPVVINSAAQYYIVTDNIINGATNGISDSGSTPKNVSGNI